MHFALKHWRNISTRAPLLRNVLVIAGGTAATAVVMALSAPLLSRLYAPRLLGALAAYSSILTMLCTITSLRYEAAIPLADEHAEAANVLALSGLVLSAVTLFMSLILIGFRTLICEWLRIPELATLFWLAPLGLLFSGATQILGYWALRKDHFPLIARTRITQGLGGVAIQISWGIANQSLPGLILGDLAGRTGGILALSRYAWHDVPREDISWKGIRIAAQRYRDFPRLNSAAAVLTAVGTQLPSVLLAHFFEPAVAGYYALTSRALSAPASLIGQAVGQSFLARAASIRKDPEALRRLTETTAIAVLAIGVPIFGVVLLDGAALFSAVFGEKWRQSGIYAQWLAPWFLLWLIATPLSNLMTVREWQGTTLKYSVLEVVVKTAALAVGIWLGSDVGTVGLLGAASFLLSLFTMNRFFKAAYTNIYNVLPKAKLSVFAGAFSLVLAAICMPGTDTWQLAVRLGIFLLCYGGLALRSRVYVL